MQPTTNLQEPVEFYLSCRKLKDLDFIGKSDPQVKVFMQNQGNWVPIGETERILDNLNPDFKTTIKVDYQFETKQHLRFEVYDVDKYTENDLIGTVESSVGEIMGARKQTATLELHGKSGKVTGTLIIRGDKIGTSQNVVVWQWNGVKLMNTDGIFGKSDPFLRFFKEKSGEWLQVHESEFIKNNLNPIWRPFQISDDKLCGGNHSQPIKVECWDNESDGRHRYIGVCEISLEKLKNGENSFQLFNDKKNKNTGTLNLVNFKIRDKITFLDYIKGGEQLNTMVAIDFTGSNGDPSSHSSLHAKLPEGQSNEYEQAIHSVCQIVLDYDYDKMIPVYGFGANLNFKTMSSFGTSHCFPCSGVKDKPEVAGLKGIMDVYRHALANLSLSGPTCFGPIVKEAVHAAKHNKKKDLDVYTILLILTDGCIDDMKEVTEAIVDAADLPLSIIIIGVGGAGFHQMETLDGDGGALTTQSGRVAARDIVQFVPFRTFRNDMENLAKHVLAEIPRQLVEYKGLVGKMPKSY